MFDQNFYKRNLPHWQPSDAEYFVTFRLAGSLPVNAIKRITAEHKEDLESAKKESQEDVIAQHIHDQTFKKYESILDSVDSGPTWLSKSSVAKIVEEAIRYRDGKEYYLYAYCIMPNHVHIVFRISGKDGEEVFPVTDILKNLKSYTALKANKELERSGAFWQSESYDRVIRDNSELEKVISYVIHNPVNAELVSDWREWSFSYCKKEFINTYI